MKTNRRVLAGILAGAMCLGAMAGCGGSGSSSSASSSGSASGSSGGEIKIGFVNEANTTLFDAKRMDAMVAAVDATDGVSIECTDGNNDIQKQIDQAKTFIAKGVDVLMLVPCDGDGIVPAVEEANNAGVPVICFGIKSNGGDYVYVGSDNYEAGHMQGEYFAEILPENAKICYLAGTAGLPHTGDRRNGFNDALQEAGRDDVEILDDQDGDYMKDEGMRITETWIQKYADGNGGVTFDAIVAANDQMALGAMEALKTANILKGNNEILISGIDGTDDGIKAVQEGYMVQTVLQDAEGQGQAGLETVKRIVAGEDVEDEVIVPFQNITLDNVEDYAS
ncbi:MAG: sugar ABC transporter substrate-binding protein [Butyricicoccus sp.]